MSFWRRRLKDLETKADTWCHKCGSTDTEKQGSHLYCKQCRSWTLPEPTQPRAKREEIPIQRPQSRADVLRRGDGLGRGLGIFGRNDFRWKK